MTHSPWPRRPSRAAVLCAALLVLVAAPALAELDSFGLGTGRSGALVLAANEWALVNSYAPVTASLAPGDTVVPIGALYPDWSTPFAAGDLVMVLQTTGLVPVPVTNGPTPIDLNPAGVGTFEFARLSTATATQLTLTRPLWQSYAGGVTQVIRVPEFTTVSVGDGGGIWGELWNGQAGGVIAFLATGLVTNHGDISTWGSGFRGGSVSAPSEAYGCVSIDEPSPGGATKGEGIGNTRFPSATGNGYVANGGGGGNCHNSGGGGGGGVGRGGKGGNECCSNPSPAVGGEGGAAVTFNYRYRLTMGGGGGGGHQNNGVGGEGGWGGGITYVRAQSMAGTGGVGAGGEGNDTSVPDNHDSTNDGAGGGGAGGTVVVRLAGTLACGWIEAEGGWGGDSSYASSPHGTGGGGGGGFILVQYAGATTCWIGAGGGGAGLSAATGDSFGASAGASGAVQTINSAYSRPPIPVITSPANGSTTTNQRPVISGTLTRNSTRVHVFIDGVHQGFATSSGTASPYTWSFTPAGNLGGGAHTLDAQSETTGIASDRASSSFTITSVAPTITVSAAPASPTNATGASFTFSASEPSSFQCKLDAGAFAPCVSPASYSGLGAGDHTFSVYAVSTATGLPSSTVARTWTIDLTAPTTTITSGPSGSVNGTSASFGFSANETGVTFRCQLDGGTVATCTSPRAYSGLGEGAHTFRVYATDAAGNQGSAASRTWTIDLTAPTTTITAGPSGTVNTTAASFSFSANETGATFRCQLDGGTVATCTSPRAYSALGEGSHTFSVFSVDPAGNTGAAVSRTWTIDVTGPSATISAGPPAVTRETTATFEFSSPEPGATLRCRLDAEAEVACTSPHSLFSVGEGAHTFTVTAVDGLGNRGTSAQRAWTVDLTPPAASITSGPAALTNSTSASFGFSASETGASFTCQLDTGGSEPCTSPKTFASIGEGAHTFSVIATDAAGNAGAPVQRAWTVDLTAPDTTILTAPPPLTGAGDASFTFTSTESPEAFECAFDGAPFTSCSSPLTVPDPGFGDHSLQVRAVDAAGNVDPLPSTHSWSVIEDRDLDGLTDSQEATHGTDPGIADTDGDFLSDGVEVNTALTLPLDPDTDDDGLSDGAELGGDGLRGPTETSALAFDSDDDGLSDGLERGAVTPTSGTDLARFVADADPATRTDPLKPDTDGDLISDWREDDNHDGRRDATETDPNLADTDGDGLGDGVERTGFNPTHPLLADTDGDGLPDGTEDANQNGRRDESETDPNAPDTDQGGVRDGVEVQGATNPLDPADDYQVIGGGCGCASTSPTATVPWALLALVIARRRRLKQVVARVAGIALALMVVVWPATSLAQTAPLSTAIDVQLLKPATGEGAVLGVYGARVQPHLGYGAALFVSHADSPLVLVVPATGERVRALVASQTTGDLLFSIGLFDWVELGIAMPVTLQSSDGLPGAGADTPALATMGAGDLRVVPKARLFDAGGFALGVLAVLGAPTGASSAFMGSGAFSVSPRLAAGYELGGWLRLGVNAGAQLRPPQQLLNLTVGNELTFGAAAGLALPAGLSLQLAGQGAYGLGGASPVGAPVEVMGALSYRVGGLTFSAGGGAGLTRGYGAPRWRALASVAFDSAPPKATAPEKMALPTAPSKSAPRPGCAFGPEDVDGFQDDDGCADPDDDGDGLLDSKDECRGRAETKNGHQDEDGCPDELPGGAKAKAPDTDGDGVADQLDLCPDLPGTTEDGCPPDDDNDGVVNPLDACPDQKETFNGFEDSDGCPDQAPAKKKPAKRRRR